MSTDYENNGYIIRRRFFADEALSAIEPILRRFHRRWLEKNDTHYKQGSINSAYITSVNSITPAERQQLFTFIAKPELQKIARAIIKSDPAFMNTQLFFNPLNAAQPNYWHRDLQYIDASIERQQQILKSSHVLHFRIPFADEPGLELMPGTHKRWDTAQELETRLKKNNRLPSHNLPGSKTVSLKRGDLLVFSANMIHRGLYGGQRFAFDILLCEADPELLRHADPDCRPNDREMQQLEPENVFAATIKARKVQT